MPTDHHRTDGNVFDFWLHAVRPPRAQRRTLLVLLGYATPAGFDVPLYRHVHGTLTLTAPNSASAGEWSYQLLSLLAKGLLGSILIVNVLLYSSFEEAVAAAD